MVISWSFFAFVVVEGDSENLWEFYIKFQHTRYAKEGAPESVSFELTLKSINFQHLQNLINNQALRHIIR